MNTGSGSITVQNTNATGAGTPGSFVMPQFPTLVEAAFITVQVTGTWTGALSIQETLDGTNWYSNGVITPISSATAAATIPSAAPGIYTASIVGAKQVRVSAQATFTGTAAVSLATTAYS
jgi:hypothetical protein